MTLYFLVKRCIIIKQIFLDVHMQASQNDLKCNLYLSVKVYNITV